MRWRAVFLAVVGLVVLAGPAAASPRVDGTVGTFVHGPLRGVAFARATDVREIELRFGLHGLDPEREHIVVGSTAPCDRRHHHGVEELWRSHPVVEDDGTVVVRGRLQTAGELAAQRSFRVFAIHPIQQIACSPGVVGRFGAAPMPGANASVATFVRGPFHGIVHSRPKGTGGADVRLSLRGLAADSTYVVAGSTAPCGRPPDLVDDEVWSRDLDTDADGGPVFRRMEMERRRGFAGLRSVRISLYNGGDEVEEACASALVGRVAPA